MGFYKNVGNATFDDVENYIKNQEWIITDTVSSSAGINTSASTSYWSCAPEPWMDSSDWNINRVKFGDTVKYYIEIRREWGGSHFKDREEITDIMPELLTKVLSKEPLYFDIETILDAVPNALSVKGRFTGAHYIQTTVPGVGVNTGSRTSYVEDKYIIYTTKMFEHKSKRRSWNYEYDSDRAYQKEQQKLARRFSSRW